MNLSLYQNIILKIFLTLLIVLGLSWPCQTMEIQTKSILKMAIYGPGLNEARNLRPDQINYNITSPELLRTIIQGIDFKRERNCSEIGSLLNAIIYIQFLNGNVARYQFSNNWSNFSSYGISSCCYQVSFQVQDILKDNAQ